MATAQVAAVHRSGSHSFSKFAEDAIALEVGLGVVGDAHAGKTVKHRSRVRRDPTVPNLRQVHLLRDPRASQSEFAAGQFPVRPDRGAGAQGGRDGGGA